MKEDKWYVLKDKEGWCIKFKFRKDHHLYPMSPFYISKWEALIDAYRGRRLVRKNGFDVKVFGRCKYRNEL